MQDSWKLSEGFVAEEGKALLPHRATGRLEKKMFPADLCFLAVKEVILFVVKELTLELHGTLRSCNQNNIIIDHHASDYM